ncbi:hypothetical protein HAX54_034253, partial [Datura stramonium]|nr:hypothetical protein [Datura stramonium]
EECDDLREMVKVGLLKKLTIRIALELELLQQLIDRANEKGWRNEYPFSLHALILSLCTVCLTIVHPGPYILQRKKSVSLTPLVVYTSPVSGEKKAPTATLMHRQCSDETTTSMKQNILEKVKLDPLAKDEKDVNQMHQCSDETTSSMKQNIPEKVEIEPLAKEEKDSIAEKVELEPLAKDEKDVNQMHQCSDETTSSKKQSIPKKVELKPLAKDEKDKQSIPKKVELEPLAKDEKDINQMHQCSDETTSSMKQSIPEKVEREPLAKDEKDVPMLR